MKLFSERKTPIENLSLIAMVSALDAILALILSFFPFSSLFIVIFLPLVSAFLALLCKWQYLPLYIIVGSLVSLLASLHDIGMVIFYVIPAIISGTLFGLLSKKGLPYSLLIFAIAVVELGFNYLAIPLIKLITEIDMIETLATLLSLSGSSLIIIPAILFLFSLCEASLCALASYFVFDKIPIEGVKKELGLSSFILPLLGLVSIGCTILFVYLSWAEVAFVFLGVSIYFSFMSIPLWLKKRPFWLYIILGITTLLGVFLAVGLYQSAPTTCALCLFSLIFLGLDVVSTFLKV